MQRSNYSLLLLSLCIFQSLKISSSQQSYFVNYNNNDWDTIECVDNTDCIVNCFGFLSCGRDTTINGPSDAKLTINCNSAYNSSRDPGFACSNFDIHAQNSTELHINVYNEDGEFEHINIYTPNNPQSPTISTFITCGIIGDHNDDSVAYSSCTNGNNIYSVNGWQSVNWTYAGDASWSLTSYSNYPNVMHCATDYLQSCSDFKLDGRYYRCAFQSECGTVRPTKAPSAAPTIAPSVALSVSPTTLPTGSSEDIWGIIGGCFTLCFLIILVVVYLKHKHKNKKQSPNSDKREEDRKVMGGNNMKFVPLEDVPSVKYTKHSPSTDENVKTPPSYSLHSAGGNIESKHVPVPPYDDMMEGSIGMEVLYDRKSAK